VAAGLKGGGVYAFSASGNTLWEEHRSSGAVTGLLFYNTPKEKDGYSGVITSQSGELRGLKISKATMLPENR
jgi:hypothetical protein